MRYDDKDRQMYSNCDICRKEVKYGKGAYGLRKIERYDLHCCSNCYDGNHDGWGPHSEPRILAILKEKKLPIPERNEKGWLPRE